MKALDFKVSGFLFSGISAGIKKDGKRDLGLIYSEVPAQVAGLFTTNAVKAAPVQLDMERIKGGLCQAVIINSGNANACTGSQGLRDARRVSSLVAKRLGIDEKLVLALLYRCHRSSPSREEDRTGNPGIDQKPFSGWLDEDR